MTPSHIKYSGHEIIYNAENFDNRPSTWPTSDEARRVVDALNAATFDIRASSGYPTPLVWGFVGFTERNFHYNLGTHEDGRFIPISTYSIPDNVVAAAVSRIEGILSAINKGDLFRVDIKSQWGGSRETTSRLRASITDAERFCEAISDGLNRKLSPPAQTLVSAFRTLGDTLGSRIASLTRSRSLMRIFSPKALRI